MSLRDPRLGKGSTRPPEGLIHREKSQSLVLTKTSSSVTSANESRSSRTTPTESNPRVRHSGYRDTSLRRSFSSPDRLAGQDPRGSRPYVKDSDDGRSSETPLAVIDCKVNKEGQEERETEFRSRTGEGRSRKTTQRNSEKVILCSTTRSTFMRVTKITT